MALDRSPDFISPGGFGAINLINCTCNYLVEVAVGLCCYDTYRLTDGQRTSEYHKSSQISFLKK